MDGAAACHDRHDRAFRGADRLPCKRPDQGLNGRHRQLEVVGVVLSPAYIYQLKPGDLFPDFARHGILWMNRPALAAAYDLDGAFNDVRAHAHSRRAPARRDRTRGCAAGTGRRPGRDRA
jgi:hypothetical protein